MLFEMNKRDFDNQLDTAGLLVEQPILVKHVVNCID